MVPEHDESGILTTGRRETHVARDDRHAQGISRLIGGRALEIFEALLQSAGRIVSKDDLMAQVWPGIVVEKNTLEVHISTIRRALGPDRGLLRTVSGRGYVLHGSLALNARDASETSATHLPPAPQSGPPDDGNLPLAAAGLIGRATELTHVRDLLSASRLVTLTGPGGIGKTQLALMVARSLLPEFQGKGWLVELASLTDPALVPSSVAAVLRLGLSAITQASIASAIGGQKILIVMDNCEHVIDAVAGLVEVILRACPCAVVLATSREMLRIASEHVWSVRPLDVPAQDEREPDVLLRHSAVALFVARASAAASKHGRWEANLPTIAAICRRLDGIPLAIEFAASRAATLGVDQVASRLDDRFALLTTGRRTALPRQQTLRATLDWSYDLLPEPERRALNALAVFAGGFTLEAAVSVLNRAGETASTVEQSVASLVEKSLVAKYDSGDVSRWRLLETVRAYALGKLAESGEVPVFARLHAVYFRDLLVRSSPELTPTPVEASEDVYSREIDNVRAAIEWAFSDNGDPMTGVILAAAFARIWLRESLMFECQEQAGRALDALAGVGSTSSDASTLKMALLLARSEALIHTSGSGPETISSWTKALEVAERVGNTECSLRALWGLWSIVINVVNFREIFVLLEKFRDLANQRSDPTDTWIGERMMGVSLHFFGDQIGARRHIEHLLGAYDSRVHKSDIVRFPFDKRISALTRLGVILWLLGYPDRAMRAVEDSVAEAVTTGHVNTLATVLAQGACRVALARGDLVAAERLIRMLQNVSARNDLRIFRDLVPCFEGMLLVRQGETDRGSRLLRDSVNDPAVAQYSLWFSSLLLDLGDAYGLAGDTAMGLATIDRGLERTERLDENWCHAELLHIKGRLTCQRGLPNDAAAAEALLRRSIEVAREQATLSWELRAATTLAKIWREQGRIQEARDLLAPVYGRFTEGFGTSDLRTAETLLAELG